MSVRLIAVKLAYSNAYPKLASYIPARPWVCLLAMYNTYVTWQLYTLLTASIFIANYHITNHLTGDKIYDMNSCKPQVYHTSLGNQVQTGTDTKTYTST